MSYIDFEKNIKLDYTKKHKHRTKTSADLKQHYIQSFGEEALEDIFGNRQVNSH